MKKIFASLLAASMMLVAFNANAQLSAGAGYLNSTLSGQANGNAIDPVASNGFFAGASFNLALPVSGLSLNPGAYVSFISNTEKNSVGTGSLTQNTKSTFSEIALNVPVHVNYAYELAGDTKVFAFAGPTFALGLSSKTRTVLTGLVESDDTRDHYAKNDYNNFNLYLGGGLGAEVSGIIIKVGYDFGLLNLYKGDSSDTNYKRSNLYIGVGYAF